MQTYTTQMDAARKGIVTPQMETVAKKEYRTVEEIRQLVAEGKVAIPANKHHTCLDPEGIGSMLRTKINVNLGVSRDCKDYSIEMQKVMSAVNMGAEAIMDLSSHGNTQPFRRRRGASARRGRRGLRHPPLRHHPQDHRADPQAQAEDEHRQPRRLSGLCMDVYDRQ